MNWLIKFIKSPRQIGSIAPSSESLSRLMTKNLAPNARVLELGAGSGAITKFIVAKLSDQSLLASVEADSELASICQNKFPDVTVLNQNIHQILSSDKKFDAIISGIPFAAMKPNERHRYFQLISERLSPGGVFIMFQYSIFTRRELKNIFGNLKTNFTPWNLPPAFVFTCKKQ